MLKRTTGRVLLTLLVITGLAGTIKNNALTKEERKFALVLMKDTYKDVFKTIKGLSAAQLDFRPAAEKWTVRECVYHIAATEKGLWSLLEGLMRAPANPEKRAEIKVTDEAFVTMVKDRSRKAQAPENFQPKNIPYKSIEEALADFKVNRLAHIRYMKTSTEDLRNHMTQMPFGWIDGYQLYLLIAAHSNRHTQQIREVMESKGFPSQ